MFVGLLLLIFAVSTVVIVCIAIQVAGAHMIVWGGESGPSGRVCCGNYIRSVAQGVATKIRKCSNCDYYQNHKHDP